MPTTQTALISVHFSNVLKSWLTPFQMQELVQLTRIEQDKTICHSHDYCDANMAMDAAFKKMGIVILWPSDVEDNPELEQEYEKQTALWNNAWSIAKQNLFFTTK